MYHVSFFLLCMCCSRRITDVHRKGWIKWRKFYFNNSKLIFSPSVLARCWWVRVRSQRAALLWALAKAFVLSVVEKVFPLLGADYKSGEIHSERTLGGIIYIKGGCRYCAKIYCCPHGGAAQRAGGNNYKRDQIQKAAATTKALLAYKVVLCAQVLIYYPLCSGCCCWCVLSFHFPVHAPLSSLLWWRACTFVGDQTHRTFNDAAHAHNWRKPTGLISFQVGFEII